jgi:ATP-dependent Lon protease
MATDPVRTYPSDLPALALRETVVFPLTLQPLAISRPHSIEAVNRALAGDRLLFLTLQNIETDDPQPSDLRSIGTIAAIRQMAKVPNGGIHVIVEGLRRGRADLLSRTENILRATVNPAPEDAERTLEVDAYVRRLQELIDRALSVSSGLSQELRTMVAGIDDPLRLAYLLSSLLDMKAEEKQQILETDKLLRQAAVGRCCAQPRDRAARTEGQDRVGRAAGDDHRAAAVLPAPADEGDPGRARRRRQAETQELRSAHRRRRSCPSMSTPSHCARSIARAHDAGVARVPDDPHLHGLGAGRAVVEDHRGSARPVGARAVLDEDHYDLDKIKDRIVEYLAVQKLKAQQTGGVSLKGPILCFVGPPGVGKTSLGQSIARAMNRKFVRISLGGVRDEAEIRGHRRTYIGAIPGRIVQALKQAGAMNPVFMLDEIDKISAGYQGDPAAALLEVLDPSQNHSFRDHYLEINIDLSKVLFIATSNQLGTVHPALLDRMEIIQLAGYSEEEKLHIATRYLVPRQLTENGLSAGQVVFEDAAIRRIASDYTREAGVRGLERQIGTVARKVAARVASASEPLPPAVIRADDMSDYLGLPRFQQEVSFRVSRPGVATGLAWTEAGGDVLFVEASLLPSGHNNLILTGQLGNVMQESARAALSHVRSTAKDLGIDLDILDKHDLHVHVPAGAIPKDGPSAGITMATAIVSALRNQKVREDVAMTGEITLSGLVLPIGGIREKALAAKRFGIKTLIYPSRNSADVAELPPEVKEQMEFVPAATLEDVLRVALPQTEAVANR